MLLIKNIKLETGKAVQTYVSAAVQRYLFNRILNTSSVDKTYYNNYRGIIKDL